MKNYFYFLLMALVLACQPQQEQKDEVKPLDVTYADGIYRGEYDAFDNYSWKPFIEIQIRGGKIVSASWDETNQAGEFKSQNQWYSETMKKQSGVTPVEASNVLIDRLVARNGADIDTVTGATHTSQRFRVLADAVLKNILAGKKDKTVLPLDEVYTVESERDAENFVTKLQLSFKGGKIVEVRLDKYDVNNNSYRAGTGDANKKWDGIAKDLEKQLLEKQQIELVTPPSGGENLTEVMRGLVRRILQKRDYR